MKLMATQRWVALLPIATTWPQSPFRSVSCYEYCSEDITRSALSCMFSSGMGGEWTGPRWNARLCFLVLKGIALWHQSCTKVKNVCRPRYQIIKEKRHVRKDGTRGSSRRKRRRKEINKYVRHVCVLLARIARSKKWKDGGKVGKIKWKTRRKKNELLNSRHNLYKWKFLIKMFICSLNPILALSYDWVFTNFSSKELSATLLLGEINTGTWPSWLGEYQLRQ
jgi:hypothetical protein